jgi:hypothetical protein
MDEDIALLNKTIDEYKAHGMKDGHCWFAKLSWCRDHETSYIMKGIHPGLPPY